MAIINQIASNNENNEPLRLMLIGSRETLTQVIHILHHINLQMPVIGPHFSRQKMPANLSLS